MFPHEGGVSPQAVQNYRDQFTSLLRRRHVERGVAPVTVSVHLDRVEPLMGKESRIRLAERLLDFVSDRIPREDSHVEYDWDGLPSDIFEAGVSHLGILRHRNLTDPFWTQPYSGFLQESTGALVQEVIDRKSRSRVAYQEKAMQHWLVIVSGAQGLHSILDFDRDVLTTEYVAAFERVFLFRLFGPSVHELKLRLPGAKPAPLPESR